jgi:hypothetical protein
MTNSIENEHNIIINKIDLSNKLINKLYHFINYEPIEDLHNFLFNNHSLDNNFKKDHSKTTTTKKKTKSETQRDKTIELINKSKLLLSHLSDDYNVSTAQPLSDYYKNIQNSAKLYSDAILVNNIDGRFNSIINNLKFILSKIKNESQNESFDTECYLDMIKDLQLIQNQKISNNTKYINYDFCCDKKMLVLADKSELYCEECNNSMSIIGMVFNEAQFYCQDVKKAKHGKYEVLRNYGIWLDHIYATDGYVMPEKMKARLHHYLNRERLGPFGNAKETNIAHVREFLEENEFSDHNKYCSSILSQIVGVYPPVRTDKDTLLLTNYFNRIVMFLQRSENNIKSNKKHIDQNIPYAPYWVSKIVQALWENDFEKQRIQAYIFHKKADTVEKLDEKWESMCPYLGFKFIPTDTTRPPIKPYYDNLRVQRLLEHKTNVEEIESYISF